MAEVPTEEQLQEARDKLAGLRAESQSSLADKEAEAAAARRAAEWEALQREIAFQEEANRIMGFEGSMDPTEPEVPETTEESGEGETAQVDPSKAPNPLQPNTAGRDLSLGGGEDSDDEKGE